MLINIIIKLLLVLLLVGVVLAVIFSPREGLKDKIVNLFLSQEETLPGELQNKGETKEILSQEHKSEISALRNTIQHMMGSDKKNCFSDFGGFSSLENVVVSMQYDAKEGKTDFTIFGGAGGQQIATDQRFSIEGMAPCVIAGEGIGSEFEEFIVRKGVVSFNPTGSIRITQTDGGAFGLTNNKLDYGDGFKVFESSSVLFTPNNKHICFFPLEDGVDTDYLDSTEGSISQRLKDGQLITC